MINNLDINNIKGFAMFKYKGIPKKADISKIVELYEKLSKRKTEKIITVFDWEGEADTICFDNNNLWLCEDDSTKISNTEEVLGYFLAYLVNYKEVFIIVREKSENGFIVYGFHIIGNELITISKEILEEMNQNSKKTNDLNPEVNVTFIEIQ